MADHPPKKSHRSSQEGGSTRSRKKGSKKNTRSEHRGEDALDDGADEDELGLDEKDEEKDRGVGSLSYGLDLAAPGEAFTATLDSDLTGRPYTMACNAPFEPRWKRSNSNANLFRKTCRKPAGETGQGS